MNVPGYLLFWNPAKRTNYSGTLVLSRRQSLSCQYGLGIDTFDEEGRLITLEYKDCQVGEHKTCPLWLVNDPPDEAIWYKINLQLDEVPAKRKAALEQAIAVGPPRHEILILTDTPERRGELTGWMKKIYSVWNVALPPLNVPEDVKGYLRELRGPCAPPEAVTMCCPGEGTERQASSQGVCAAAVFHGASQPSIDPQADMQRRVEGWATD